MHRNMNMLDRRLRAFVIAPVALALGLIVGPASAGSVVLYAVAAIMLATGSVGYCPLYAMLHIRTTR